MTGLRDSGLRNRRAVPLGAVPRESVDEFRRTVIEAVQDGWRLAAMFGMPHDDEAVLLTAVLADDARGELGATTTVVRERYPALT
ncbi:MAG: hypothetical protein KGJ70_13495, partial [Gemmatimonadota bacterium]|nr:hypothetical protein [Gemmatimonadota bacterium]